MTVSHAHARNACAHEQSTNIESGAVQWHKQSEQLLVESFTHSCFQRSQLCAKPPFCHKQKAYSERTYKRIVRLRRRNWSRKAATVSNAELDDKYERLRHVVA